MTAKALSPPCPPAMLRGVDRAALAVALSVRLQHAGVAVGFSAMGALARAMDVAPVDSLPSFYWTARICLVRRQNDLALFDTVFASIFEDMGAAVDPHARRRPLAPGDDEDTLTRVDGRPRSEQDGGGLPWTTLPQVVSSPGEHSAELALAERLPSGLEGLAETPFDELDPTQLALLSGWLESALTHWPTRRTRREVRHHSGRRPALRPTLARARRTGWEPIELVRTRPVRRRRRVVMLCDVSQSMQPYSAAYLHLMRAVALSTDAEVFAFATSLTRLTSVLAHKSPVTSVEQATAKVSDRFGGTRIATNVRALLASRHGGSTRGAIVMIASDGWDSDPPEELGKVMARLHRRAYRVLWLNPRAAAPGFAPLVGAMSAALPYCDLLLPAHNVKALADVIDAVVRTAGPVSSNLVGSDLVSSRG